MSESILMTLMKLFAILTNINKDISLILSRNFVESYLKTQFNPRIVEHSLIIYDSEINNFSKLSGTHESKRTSSLSVKILSICNEINRELPVRSKYIILFSLIQFAKYFEEKANSPDEFIQTISDTIKTISDYMMVDDEEFNNCRIFITDKFYKVPKKENLLIMSNDKMINYTRINHLYKNNLTGQFFFLKIHKADVIIFYYTGTARIEFNGKSIFPQHIYIFPKGSVLKAAGITPIYYSDIQTGFFNRGNLPRITFHARDIEFKFPNSEMGIHPFSFMTESGNLTGIMGSSGAGKSTLLKLLNGTYKCRTGQIYLNGYEYFKNRKKLKGLIGYVPQDDLLIGELTVYQNLYYCAKLCLEEVDDLSIDKIINSILSQLDLFHIKDLPVGSPLNKKISGGQRKRLNIALELLKEPYVLFADEPTTGLSSTDSENVMQLLKDLSLQGRIVIVTIHQPSSELFKMLDKLIVLDKGGFPVYTGNPLNAISYLKNIAGWIDAAEIECPYCGIVQPEEILKVIEARHVNESGEYISDRIISPDRWYELYLNNIQENQILFETVTQIPSTKFKVPGYLRQFLTYSSRNFYSKVADTQFVTFSLLISPVLAVILSYITKYFSGDQNDSGAYLFIQNVNLPAYLFMSVIVALFIGLIISAEDIFKDRKIIEREKFLDLSRTSYLNSKISFLFILTSLQMLAFVLIGNYILEIKGMTFSYWMVLFSTAGFAVMLGLIISSALRSIIAIYMTIPFILVPLILLSGVIVKYDKMHYRISSAKYVPVIGDLMASRWAYEALLVNQFKNNAYQKYFYSIDRESANLSWELNFLIPALYNNINDYERLKHQNQSDQKITETVSLIKNSICNLKDETIVELPNIDSGGNLNIPVIIDFLNRRKSQLKIKTNSLVYERDKIFVDLKNNGMSNEDIIRFKEEYYNKSIADIVLNVNEMTKITEYNNNYLRKASPVYQIPLSKSGRAQFYSGIKRLGSFEIDTLWFNVMILWLMTIALYFILVTNVLKKVIDLLLNSGKGSR